MINFISIISCSDELKELEAKLRAGYVSRERAAQLAEKQADRMLEKVHFVSSTISDMRMCYACSNVKLK